MGLTFGFYNSIDGDRRYDADQFSSFLDGIVYDGVYGAYGNCFHVINNETEDLGVIVDTGRAWFNHTWTLNDTYYNLTMPVSDLLLDRIDAVVIEVNKEERTNYIKVVQGTPAESPVRPTLKGRSGEATEEIYQYALAYVARPAASTTVTQEQIVYVVDTSETPLCSALALAGIPSGGKIGQVLAKKSSESAAVGWYDWNHLPSEKPWYIVDGITEENVIAAWEFKDADTLAEALTSINKGTTYILTKTDNVTFTTGSGLLFPDMIHEYVYNDDISDICASIYSCAFRYAGILTDSYVSGGVFLFNSQTKRALHASSVKYEDSAHQYYPASTFKSISDGAVICIGSYYPEGVLAANYSATANSIFYNGLNQSVTNKTGHSTLNGIWNSYANGRNMSKVFTSASAASSKSIRRSPIQLYALVFYNTPLSDAQHIQLAENMNNL